MSSAGGEKELARAGGKALGLPPDSRHHLPIYGHHCLVKSSFSVAELTSAISAAELTSAVSAAELTSPCPPDSQPFSAAKVKSPFFLPLFFLAQFVESTSSCSDLSPSCFWFATGCPTQIKPPRQVILTYVPHCLPRDCYCY